MTADRDATRIVRSWLEDGVTALPDRVLEAVLDQLPATPQRRATWPARRFSAMNRPLQIALIAAAILVAAIVGYRLLPSNIGNQPTPSPTPSATSAPTAVAFGSLGDEAIPIGDVSVGSTFDVPLMMTVPLGWAAVGSDELSDNVSFHKDRTGEAPLWVGFSLVENLYADPCHAPEGGMNPVVGPSVDDLAQALGELPGFDSGPVADVTIDGHTGKRLDLTTDIDPATSDCDDATWLFVWEGENGSTLQVPGPTNLQITILDVDGTRLVMWAEYWEGRTSAEELAEAQDILASIRFE
jgi:hypothetical protein